ncbi:MAG: hypothetical protein ABH843_02220 [Candidatus Omnitrophota bacterium]
MQITKNKSDVLGLPFDKLKAVQRVLNMVKPLCRFRAHNNIVHLSILLFFSVLLSCNILYAAEVEDVDKAEIPQELEEAIELRKVSEFKVIPLIDITALGTWSKIEGGGSLGGANIKGSIAPALRFDKNNYIIPLYSGGYNRERQVVVEEEGGRVYNEIMDHNITIEYKHILDDKTSVKIDGLVRSHFVKEKGYDWSDGLYDYRDFGVGSTIEYYLEKTKTAKSSIGVGGEYYYRDYPNYTSLIALATVTAPETDEKNYNGFHPNLKYKYQDSKINTSIFYSPLYKAYDDKKVIDTNGVLSDKERSDWFHYITGDFSYLPADIPVAFGIGLTGIFVDSNQNYYDSRSTVTLADDVFTSDYYDFNSLKVNPNITYIHRLEDKKSPATLTLGYAFTRRDYGDRKAQRADSSYTADTQLDELNTLNAQAVYPLTEHVSFVAAGNYTDADSNMDYETYYQYNYKSYFAGAGIRIKY